MVRWAMAALVFALAGGASSALASDTSRGVLHDPSPELGRVVFEEAVIVPVHRRGHGGYHRREFFAPRTREFIVVPRDHFFFPRDRVFIPRERFFVPHDDFGFDPRDRFFFPRHRSGVELRFHFPL